MADRPVLKPWSEKTLRELAQELGCILAEHKEGVITLDGPCHNTITNVHDELLRRHELTQPAAATVAPTPAAQPTPQQDIQGPYGKQHDLPDADFFRADRGPGGGYLNAGDNFSDDPDR